MNIRASFGYNPSPNPKPKKQINNKANKQLIKQSESKGKQNEYKNNHK